MRLTLLLSVLATATATPLPLSPRAASAASLLLQIAPTSSTCASSPFPAECQTASQAAPHLITTMSRQGIYAPPELAAVLALIAYESGEFKYARNHYPGRLGQGTRNMQMGAFNLEYALSLPGIGEKALGITGGVTGGAGVADGVLDQVLELLLVDQEAAWGSAGWFYTTKCADVRGVVKSGSEAGWTAYMGCVGVEATAERTAYWVRAKEAFGLV